MEEKTLGEIRIRIDFNESGNSTVNDIKRNSAQMIDLLKHLQTDAGQSEKNRLIAIAQTKYEEAAMWAVKAATA
jgi:hypothetical protein